MPILHLAVLAIVQGITEFLPVSSSAHLVLVPIFMGWPDQGLILDVAVHVGTLGAVMLYLWRDMFDMLAGLSRLLKGRYDAGAKLALYLIIATLPVVGAGYLMNQYYPGGLRSILVIGWATLGFGVLLWIIDKTGMTLRRIEHLGISDILIMGFAQVLALIPGTSRSGITMTAGRLLGMERPEAARLSMLMSIPVIIGAGVLEGYKLYKLDDVQLTSDVFVAAGLAFGTALISIALLMAWVQRASFTPFALYRIALGSFLLGISYGII